MSPADSDRLRDRDHARNSGRLRERAAGQREMVRWWAAECRQRNALCRRRFSAANVASATAARAILRDYARAWSQTRELISQMDRLGIGTTGASAIR